MKRSDRSLEGPQRRAEAVGGKVPGVSRRAYVFPLGRDGGLATASEAIASDCGLDGRFAAARRVASHRRSSVARG